MMGAQIYGYIAVLLAALFIIGVITWRRSDPHPQGFKTGTIDDAFNRWLIEGINNGRVDLSGLVSTDEEITIGGIRFKGEIKVRDSKGGGGDYDSTRPIVRLRNPRLEEA